MAGWVVQFEWSAAMTGSIGYRGSEKFIEFVTVAIIEGNYSIDDLGLNPFLGFQAIEAGSFPEGE